MTQKEYGKLFPDISIETIRLDINERIEKGILKNMDETKGVLYRLSPNLNCKYIVYQLVEYSRYG